MRRGPFPGGGGSWFMVHGSRFTVEEWWGGVHARNRSSSEREFKVSIFRSLLIFSL